MDDLEILLGMALLALPLMLIASFVMGLTARGRLNRIEQRLDRLEVRVAAAPRPSPWTAQPAAETPAEPEAVPPEPESAPTPSPAEPTEPPAAPTLDDIFGTTPQQPQPAAQPAAPAGPSPSFEERFGTRWVVWVGGVALALGGIFLVRYSIEAGLLGPGARIFLSSLLAAALVAAGEWTRRREIRTGIFGIGGAHIPSILTAAGTTVAYATAYGAYGLYDLLPAAVAFVLLGLVALATLAAALLHGPALAGLGLVGAYVTPILVSTGEPNWWALTVYLAVVTAAAFGLALVRLWRWLAITAVVFSALWALPGIIDGGDALLPTAVLMAAGLILAAALIVAGLFLGPPAEPGRIDWVSSGAVGAYLLVAALFVLANQHDGLTLGTFGVLVAGALAIAWRTDAAVPAVPLAAVLTALVMADWAVEAPIGGLILEGDPTRLEVDPATRPVTGHLVAGTLFAALFAAGGYLTQGRAVRALPAMLWAGSAVFAPLAILVALHWRIGAHDHSIPFAALALILAGLYAGATELLQRRPHAPGMAAAVAIFAVGGVGGLALALTFALKEGWLTVALGLMVPGIAWIAQQRPVPALRWLAGAMVAVLAARVIWFPEVVEGLGTTPVFNWLLWGYGVPAAGMWLAAWIMRKRADDIPARMVDGGAILFTVLTVFLEVRHYIHAGDIYAASSSLAETALDVNAALAMAIGLERVRLRTNSVVHNAGALVMAGLAAAGCVFVLLVLENPAVTCKPVGGDFINLVLLGYLLPGLMLGVLAFQTRATRPQWYRGPLAGLAVVMGLFYLGLEVRVLFRGTSLSGPGGGSAELYAYSVAWLAYSVALLLAGLLLGSQPARFASAMVMLLVIAKVFLIDLADLEGVYRALSFIGLGAVLVAIGWLYQRLLFRKAPPPAAAVPPP